MGTRKRKPKRQCPFCNKKFGIPGYFNHVKACSRRVYEKSREKPIPDYDHFMKIVVVGDEGCGKSGLISNFVLGYHPTEPKVSMGMKFYAKTLQISNDVKVQQQIMEISGHERFVDCRCLYFVGARGAILLYDVSNRESYEHLPNWVSEIKEYSGDIPLLLLGNTGKTSNLGKQRAISQQEAIDLAKELGIDVVIEGSIIDGVGIGDPFAIITCMVLGIPVPKQFISGKHVIKRKKPKKIQLKPGSTPIVFSPEEKSAPSKENKKKKNKLSYLVICNVCKAVVDAKWKFCNKCGNLLK